MHISKNRLKTPLSQFSHRAFLVWFIQPIGLRVITNVMIFRWRFVDISNFEALFARIYWPVLRKLLTIEKYGVSDFTRKWNSMTKNKTHWERQKWSFENFLLFRNSTEKIQFLEISKLHWKKILHLNVKFSKGHLSAPKPKSEDIEKSMSRMKKW